MMNSKKILSVLLCIAMTVSMVSCFALGVSAADHNLGYAVSVEEGSFVGGKPLPNDVVIVNDDWLGKTGRVALRLDGQVYYGWLGQNAFASLAKATESAIVHSGNSDVRTEGSVVYVAPGVYNAPVDVYGNNVRIYGPMAGVCPNEADIATPNAARPAAVGGLTKEEAALTEAVITNRVTLIDHGIDTIIEGFYFTGNAYLYTQQGYKHRTGFYIRNNIFEATTDTIMNFTVLAGQSTAYRGDVVFSENRVMGCTKVMEMYFVMDAAIENNYIDVSSVAVTCNTVEANSIGDNLRIDGNYFPTTAGLFEFIVTTNYDTLLQGVTISNNIVADCSANGLLINYNFLGDKTVPGTMLTITGNEFRKLSAGKVPFQFYYKESSANYMTFRHIINITNNLLELPVGAKLLTSDVKGVINLQGNRYSNGITKKQISLGDDETKVLLYPYTDLSTHTEYGSFVDQISGLSADRWEIDHEKHLITLDLTGMNVDYLDLTNMVVTAGCTWSLYEDEPLNTKINNKVLYLDGTQTDRYLYLETDDDGFGEVYRIHAIREPGTKAEMLGVVFNHHRDIPNEGTGNRFVYNLNSAENFVDHQIKVSAGATYKLYKDAARTTPLEDMGSYIPYGGYTFYVVVTSEDGLLTNQYEVTYNRDASSNDPAVISMSADKTGDAFVRSNLGMLIYALKNLESEITVTLETSPKSTYVIKDKDGKELSSSQKPAALKLVADDNEFTVEVTDANELTKTLVLTVENGEKSADATIVGVEGVSATVANGVVTFVGGGDNTTVTFSTRSPYAVCDVYIDEAKTESKKMSFTATQTPDVDGVRVAESRTFALPTALITNRYFVVCTAEDGVTTQEYELVITKNAQVKPYSDVADPNMWYYDEVYAAGEKGYLIGDGATFRPGDNITRQEMAMILVRLVGVNPANYSKETLPYADAANISAWATDAVKACHALGIFTGSNDNGVLKFNPKNAVSRQDAMLLFARALDLSGTTDLSRFADANQVAQYANAGVQAAVSAGLIQGNTQGQLKPKDTINRAEMAAICSRVSL